MPETTIEKRLVVTVIPNPDSRWQPSLAIVRIGLETLERIERAIVGIVEGKLVSGAFNYPVKWETQKEVPPVPSSVIVTRDTVQFRIVGQQTVLIPIHDLREMMRCNAINIYYGPNERTLRIMMPDEVGA